MDAPQFEMKCSNVMGMPLDVVSCERCGESQSFWGMGTYARMEQWTEEHTCEEEA